MRPTQVAAPRVTDPRVYLAVNPAVFQRIPDGVRKLLDIGCGGGVFGAAVKSARACAVVGVTSSEAEAQLARMHLDHVEVADLNVMDPAPLGRYDCIICSHVLEHLNNPERLLQALRECLTPGGVVIVALPNVLHWKQRMQFIRGRFRYTEGGLMDATHMRFFDWNTSAELLTEAGYRILSRHADGILPLARLLGSRLASRLNRAALSQIPGLLGTQFIMTCQREDAAVPLEQVARSK